MFSFNVRELKRQLKRMGIELEEHPDVVKVEILKTSGEKIVVEKAQVVSFKMGNQQVFQVVGEARVEKQQEASAEHEAGVKISEEDIKFVMEQTGATYEEARKALLRTRGDIIQAIMELKGS